MKNGAPGNMTQLQSSTKPASHFVLRSKEESYSNCMLLHNAISEQIWREQQLVSNRMQWNFSFQAFLAAIYVFSASNFQGLNELIFQAILCFVGGTVSYFCLQGVTAAQNQSSRLKEHWTKEFSPAADGDYKKSDLKSGAFPQPFSDSKGSNRGRLASRGVCWVLIAMWVLFLCVVAMRFLTPQQSLNNHQVLVCALTSAPNEAKNFPTNCRVINSVSPLVPSESQTITTDSQTVRKTDPTLPKE